MLTSRKRVVRNVCKMLVCAIFLSIFAIQSPVSADSTTTQRLRVLEIQPGNVFELSEVNNQNLDIVQMSMAEFISKIEPVNGNYDIVYVGCKQDTNISGKYYKNNKGTNYAPNNGYFKFQASDKIAFSDIPYSNASTSKAKEYYSDNDITKLAANKIKEFIASRQLTIFNINIFTSTYSKTNLYGIFNGYRSNYNNFQLSNNILTSDIRQLYNSCNKRPILTVDRTSLPVEYSSGNNLSYETARTMNIKYKAVSTNSSSSTMTVKLYLDINGDGLFTDTDTNFEANEVASSSVVASGSEAVISTRVPEDFTGLMPWKLEITDDSCGAKTYMTGMPAYKGIPLNIKILQIVPSGNTLRIADFNNLLLHKSGEYDIDVTTKTLANYNAAPEELNGKYDMIILGFQDMYGDITNAMGIKYLKDYIDSKQSVMFTHDTLTFLMKGTTGWGYNITKNFRDLMGQNKYFSEMANSSDSLFDTQAETYGFSRLTLHRGINDGPKTTTSAYRLNSGLLTMYPFVIPKNLSISSTHQQYFQLNLEDERVIPWFTLQDGNNNYNKSDGRNDYYTYTKGSITYSGTGHTAPGEDEKKLFINTIIKAARGSNHAPSMRVNGIFNEKEISKTDAALEFTVTPTDIDPKDNILKVNIYKSTDGKEYGNPIVKDENAQNSVEKKYSISNNNTRLNNYYIKIVIEDKSGAESEPQIFKINNLSEPTLQLSSDSQGRLIGDSVNIGCTIEAQPYTSRRTYKDISVTTRINNPSLLGLSASSTSFTNSNIPDAIFGNNTVKWGDKGATITGRANYPISTLSATCSSEGVVEVTPSITYGYFWWINKASYEASKSYISIRRGNIYIATNESNGPLQKSIPVNFNVSGSSSTDTKDMGGSNSSSWQYSSIPSKTYSISIEKSKIPEGKFLKAINVKDGLSNTIIRSSTADEELKNQLIADKPTVTINLSYEFPKIGIEFVFGNIVDIISYTDRDGKKLVNAYNGKPVRGYIDFTLNDINPVALFELDFAIGNSIPNSYSPQIKNVFEKLEKYDDVTRKYSSIPGAIKSAGTISLSPGRYRLSTMSIVKWKKDLVNPGNSVLIELGSDDIPGYNLAIQNVISKKAGGMAINNKPAIENSRIEVNDLNKIEIKYN